MNKRQYIKELDSISMNAEFKEVIKEKLYNESIHKHKWNLKVISLCIISACIFITIGLYNSKTPNHNPNSQLPNETPSNSDIPDSQLPTEIPSKFIINNQEGGGFGFEGIMVKDVSELKTSHPYDLNKSSSKMPVYQNIHKSDGAGIESNPLSDKEKKELLISYAKKLQISDYTFQSNEIEYILKSSICTIKLEQSTSIFIEFSQEYLQNNKIDMNVKTIQEGENVTKKLYEKFQNILGITNPLYHVSYDYTYDAHKHWEFIVSEKMNNQNDSLIYSLAQHATFYNDDNGFFWGLRIQLNNLNTFISDYPIISLDEAKKRLYEGRFGTTIQPLEITSIGHVEMTYRISSYTDYYLPYYRFYVLYEDEESQKSGLKTYVACYVSALPDQYIDEDYNEIQFN